MGKKASPSIGTFSLFEDNLTEEDEEDSSSEGESVDEAEIRSIISGEYPPTHNDEN